MVNLADKDSVAFVTQHESPGPLLVSLRSDEQIIATRLYKISK